MGAASFRNPQSGTTDNEQAGNQEYSPLLGPQGNQASSGAEDRDSMPTKRSLLASNLFGGPKALATQVNDFTILGITHSDHADWI